MTDSNRLENWYNVIADYNSYTLKPNPELSDGYRGGAYLMELDEDRCLVREMFIPPEALSSLGAAFVKAATEVTDDD